MDSLSQTAWFCFRALPKKEGQATRQVRERTGLEAYCPHITYRKKKRSGYARVTEALFPGYLFVRCDIERDRRHLLALHGMRAVVRYGDFIPQVPETFIIGLQAAMGGETAVAPEPALELGREVVILAGPLADFSAVINGLVPARDRVRLLLDFLGRQVTVEMPVQSVMVKNPQPKSLVLKNP